MESISVNIHSMYSTLLIGIACTIILNWIILKGMYESVNHNMVLSKSLVNFIYLTDEFDIN